MTVPLSSSESTMPEGFTASKLLTIVLGGLATLVTTGVIAIIAMLVGMGDRLVRMETTIDQNKAERKAIDGNLERRVERIERDLYERRRNGDDR